MNKRLYFLIIIILFNGKVYCKENITTILNEKDYKNFSNIFIKNLNKDKKFYLDNNGLLREKDKKSLFLMTTNINDYKNNYNVFLITILRGKYDNSLTYYGYNIKKRKNSKGIIRHEFFSERLDCLIYYLFDLSSNNIQECLGKTVYLGNVYEE